MRKYCKVQLKDFLYDLVKSTSYSTHHDHTFQELTSLCSTIKPFLLLFNLITEHRKSQTWRPCNQIYLSESNTLPSRSKQVRYPPYSKSCDFSSQKGITWLNSSFLYCSANSLKSIFYIFLRSICYCFESVQ